MYNIHVYLFKTLKTTFVKGFIVYEIKRIILRNTIYNDDVLLNFSKVWKHHQFIKKLFQFISM